VVAPGGHGSCGTVAAVDDGVFVLGVVEPGVPVAFAVDGVCLVLVIPVVVVAVPVPVPEFLGCVDVPVPAPAGTQGGAAIGDVGVEGAVCGVLGVVCGVGACVPDGVGVIVLDGVGVIVPDGVGAIVPDGVGAVVPDGVGAVDGVWLCAAMPTTDIVDAKTSAVVSLVSVWRITLLL
jgi:hypothetical protein